MKDKIAQLMQDTAGNAWGTEAHFQRFAAALLANEPRPNQGQPATAWIFKPNKELLWPDEVEVLNPNEDANYIALVPAL